MKTKRIAEPIVVGIITAIILVAACFGVYASCNSYMTLRQAAGTQPVCIDENGDAMHYGKIYDMPQAMTFTNLQTAGEETSSVTIQAVITPSVAANKTVDWSVAFVNPDNEWVKDKTVTDYVTVTPTSDGALTAIVACLQPFGAQIKVTVTSRSNTDATASCTVDYVARLADNVTLTFTGTSFVSSGKLNNSDVQTVQTLENWNWNAMSAECNETFGYGLELEYQLNSKYPSLSTAVFVKPTAEFYTQLQAQGINRSANDWVEVPYTRTVGDIFNALSSEPLETRTGNEDYAPYYENVDKFNAAVAATTNNYHFEIKITVTTAIETKSYVFKCQFDTTGAAFAVKSVTLSSGALEFGG